MIWMRIKFKLAVFFTIAGLFFSVTMISAELDSLSSEDYEKLFKDNLRRGTLNLSGKKIGDRGLDILLKQGFLTNLKKLVLRYNGLSPAGAKMLAKAQPFFKLKTLVLKHNFFADEGTVALAKSDSFPQLESLQLGWN